MSGNKTTQIIGFLIILLFIILGAIVYYERQSLLFLFSPQAKVDPQTVQENFDPSCTTAICDNITIEIPQTPTPSVAVLIPTPTPTPSPNPILSGEKRIEVDLTNQRVYAFEGEQKVFDFLVSTGKYDRTPVGTFQIWIKLRYTRMTGGSQALNTYYDLPNVPYVMYFYNDKYPQSRGFGLHGTYWHHNFGHPMSHGCVNLKTEEAEKLYNWALPDLKGKTSIKATEDNPGTKVIIYGKAPTL